MAPYVHLFLVLISAAVFTAAQVKQPHILHIQVNDVGWKDVSWRDCDFKTPNLDKLRSEGVELKRFHSQPYSFHARVALLTGRYPYKLGYKNVGGKYHQRIRNVSLSLDYKLLPEYLKSNGYSTHMVGSWMLGFCDPELHPTSRGFETFYGSLGGYTDHLSHRDLKYNGFDFRKNYEFIFDTKGKYSTTLFTQRVKDIIESHHKKGDNKPLFIYLAHEALHEPLQAPDKYVDMCRTIADKNRKMRCAMMAAVDEGVGEIVDAMKRAGYDDNMFVLFTSTNGGPATHGSMNYPLRGGKGTIYEGGTRVPAVMYSKSVLPGASLTYTYMTHVTDLLPTLLEVAKVPKDKFPKNIDGIPHLRGIVHGVGTGRYKTVYDIDPEAGIGAFNVGKWKLYVEKLKAPSRTLVYPLPIREAIRKRFPDTEVGKYDDQYEGKIYFKDYAVKNCTGWTDFPYDDEGKYPSTVKCKEWELYDVLNDPSETRDLSGSLPHTLGTLVNQYTRAEAAAGPPVVTVEVPFSDPKHWKGVWQIYGCHNVNATVGCKNQP